MDHEKYSPMAQAYASSVGRSTEPSGLGSITLPLVAAADERPKLGVSYLRNYY